MYRVKSLKKFELGQLHYEIGEVFFIIDDKDVQKLLNENCIKILEKYDNKFNPIKETK